MEKIRIVKYNKDISARENICNICYILEKHDNIEYSKAVMKDIKRKYRNYSELKNITKLEVMEILNKYYDEIIEMN